MKKCLLGILVLVASVMCMACAKEKAALPVNEFPASAEAIKGALESSELDWVIALEEDWGQGQYVYTLDDNEGKQVAFVLTGALESRKLMDISFSLGNSQNVRRSYEEDWEKVFKFASYLFGGFDSENQLYDGFMKDYNNGDESFKWQEEVNGLFCTVKAEKTDNGYCLNTIRIDNTQY